MDESFKIVFQKHYEIKKKEKVPEWLSWGNKAWKEEETVSCGPPLVGTWIGALCLTPPWLWTKPKSNSYLSRGTNAHKRWEPGPAVKMCQGIFCGAVPSLLMDRCPQRTALWAAIIRHLVCSLSERVFWLSWNHVSRSLYNAQRLILTSPQCWICPRRHSAASLRPQSHQPGSMTCSWYPVCTSHLSI